MAGTKRKVLVAIDDSGHCQKAFEYYLNVVSYENDEVILLHMFTPPPPPAMSSRAPFNAGLRSEDHHHPFGHDLFLTGADNDHWVKWRVKVEQTVEQLKKTLARYEAYCDEKGVMRRAILHSGAPGEGICEMAKDNQATMIIMGSRGLNKIRRTFLGSVSDYVVQHSTVPVTVVPSK